MVRFSYEHSRAYTDQLSSAPFETVNREGVTKLPLFGDSRIRVQAVKWMGEQSGPNQYRYSRVVELETSALPSSLDLTLTSSEDPSSR